MNVRMFPLHVQYNIDILYQAEILSSDQYVLELHSSSRRNLAHEMILTAALI